MSVTIPAFQVLLVIGLVSACAPMPDQTPDPNSHESRHRMLYGLVQKFDRFDQNGDDYLTRRELVSGVNATGSVPFTPAEYDRVMKHCDTNGDGRISRREAQRAAERGPESVSR